jgi:integrase
MPTPILDTAENGKFYAFWSENRRSKRKSMGTEDRAVAEQRFAQWLLLGGHKGEPTEEGRSSLTVSQLWEVYDAKHVQREAAAPASIEYAWKNLQPHFGALTLADVTPESVEEYGASRAAGTIGRPSKPSTVRKELAALRACLNWHTDAKRKPRLVDKAELPVFDLPDESDPRDRWLTTEEIGRLMAAARALHPGEKRLTRGERFLWLALETAARKQAILDLTWARVDFEVGVIHYDVPGRKKTKKRRVSVPISTTLRPILLRMRGERTGDLVLDHKGAVWATIQSIVIRAGLAPKQPRGTGEKPKSTGISPHTLRHTAATQMARRGVPLYDIAGILGNTLAVCEKVYAKHCPGRLKAAVNSISGLYLEAAE